MNKLSSFVISVVFSLLLLGIVSAAITDVNEIDRGSVVVKELKNPAVFDLEIKNDGAPDNFTLSNSFTTMDPSRIELGKGTYEIRVEIEADKFIVNSYGFIILNYAIKGQHTPEYTDKLTLKVVTLEDAFKFNDIKFRITDNKATASFVTLENVNLEGSKVRFKSDFFDYETDFVPETFETTEIEIPLDQEKLKGKEAGRYVVEITITTRDDVKTKLNGEVYFMEGQDISVDDRSSGWIISERTINKTNEGNVNTVAIVEVKKNMISRLFTITNIEPTKVERQGLSAVYTWEKELKPGESLEVDVTTNYTLPVIILILVAGVAFVVRRYYQTDLALEKRVSFVKTKTGQFAVKVNLKAKARRSIENIQIIDRIPSSTKLYEKFGSKPDKYDHSTHRLIWNLPKMNAGEERMYTYILYSDLKIFGRFEFPNAYSTYTASGSHKEVKSNKTFFISDKR